MPQCIQFRAVGVELALPTLADVLQCNHSDLSKAYGTLADTKLLKGTCIIFPSLASDSSQ